MTSPAAGLKPGDFSGLASAYSQNRPGYAPTVARCMIALTEKPADAISAVDVGAGTGIWSRQLAALVGQVVAIEPNDDMRHHGEADSVSTKVTFRPGSGEKTGLPDGSVDLVTMASSFHWVDFDKGLAEFHRILKPGGLFVALWNPRVIDANPLFAEIERQISVLNPGIKRVSSGNSEFTATLTERLRQRTDFCDVAYLEGFHIERQSRERYLGLWKSVNDVRVQLGPEKWAKFMGYVERKTAGHEAFDVTYRTRAWAARRQR